MKTIKVIDLLNMIANKEYDKLPKKVRFKNSNSIYSLKPTGYNDMYFYKNNLGDMLIDKLYSSKDLLKELEIIEDKPTKIDEMDMTDTISDYILADKINEVIRTVNNLVERDNK